MTLSYAGINLPAWTPEAAAWTEANLSLGDVFEFSRLDDPRGSFANLTYPGTLFQGRLKVGSLFWPRGASRWAYGHFLVSEAKLAQIRAATEAGTYQAQPLVMTWEDEHTGAEVARITTDLWLLPARPLAQVARENGLYLLTLVDDRYWWWQQSSAGLTITEGTTTWEQLYASLATLLGITLTVDTIPAAYLKPSSALGLLYDYVPVLLDAVAYNVGQRLTRGLDGTVRGRNPLNAAADVVSALAIPAARSRQAGGAFLFAAGASPNDAPPQLPDSVTIAFPEVNADSGTNVPNGVLLAESVSLASLALTDIPPTTPTAPGSKFLHDSAPATYLAGVLQNEAELQALVGQFATDWYRFQLAPLDVKYAGIVPWQPDALHDAVEWTYTALGGAQGEGEVSTRILRPPFNDLTDQLLHGGGAGGTSIPPCCCPPNPITPAPSGPPIWPPYPGPAPVGTSPVPIPAGVVKFRYASSSDTTIFGFSGMVNGQVLVLWNVGPGRLVLVHNGGVPAAGGIQTPLSANYTLWPNDGLIIEYDGPGLRWRFDCPTFAAGGTSAPATYASRWLKPGTGISITDNNDGSDTIAAPGAGGAGGDIHYFTETSPIPFGQTCWYWAGQIIAYDDFLTLHNYAPTANRLFAMPFCSPRGGTLDRLAVYVAAPGAAGDKAVLGVYRSVSGTALYPTARLAQGEILVDAAGLQTVAVNIPLQPNILYWFALAWQNNGAILRGSLASNYYPYLGMDDSLSIGAAGMAIYLSRVYDGTVPAAFPPGASVQFSSTSNTAPNLAFHYGDLALAPAAVLAAAVAEAPPFLDAGGVLR